MGVVPDAAVVLFALAVGIVGIIVALPGMTVDGRTAHRSSLSSHLRSTRPPRLVTCMAEVSIPARTAWDRVQLYLESIWLCLECWRRKRKSECSALLLIVRSPYPHAWPTHPSPVELIEPPVQLIDSVYSLCRVRSTYARDGPIHRGGVRVVG